MDTVIRNSEDVNGNKNTLSCIFNKFVVKNMLPEERPLLPGTRSPGALQTHPPAKQNLRPWPFNVMSSKVTTHYLRLVYFYIVNLLQSFV